MPFLLILFGVLFIIVGVNNTQDDLLALLKDDFTPSTGHGFIGWIVAIGAIGAVGYIPRLKPVSNGFLVLVILVLVLANSKGSQGFFQQFQNQVGIPIK